MTSLAPRERPIEFVRKDATPLQSSQGAHFQIRLGFSPRETAASVTPGRECHS
jgi:hypothetical protein